MTEHPILTDTTLEAMLGRRAGSGTPPGLAASIVAALDAVPDDRRRWWSVLAPRRRPGPALQVAWVVALVGLLLAATVSAILVGSQLLRHDSDLSIVPPGTVMLTLDHAGVVTAVAWNPDGDRVATGSSTTESNGAAEWTRDVVRIWDAGTGDEVLQLEQVDAAIDRIAYSPDGSRLVIGGFDPMVYDPETGTALPGWLPEFLAFSPDGTLVATGGAWGWAGIQDATTGEVQLDLPLGPSWMWDAAWSPDGTRVATVWGSSIKVWDADTGEEQLQFGPYFVTDVEWSPDGSRIATAGDDALGPMIWDAATGDRVVTLLGHTSGVAAVDWSPDGARIASAGLDGTARVWDAASGAQLASFTGHTKPLADIAWSPDGTRIATASEDGSVKIWRAPDMAAVQPSANP
jgi:WD40 repeat protein